MSTYILYFCWFLVPAAFYLMALWAKLEKMSKSSKKHNSSDMIRHGNFVLMCAVVSLIIDMFLFGPYIEKNLPDFILPGFIRVMLYPAILFLGATVFGGSKPIRIEQKTKPGQRKKR